MTDDRLSAFLDDELDPDERAAVDARLAASPELRSELARAAEARDLVRGLPPVDPPVPLVPAAGAAAGPVVDELAERRRRRAPTWVAAAAAAAVLVVFAVVVWPSSGGSSLDVDALAANHVAMMDGGPTAASDPMPMDEAAAYGPDAAAGGWSMAAAYLERDEVVHLVYGRADDAAMVSVYRVAGGMPGDGPDGGEMMDVEGGPTWHGERQGMPVLVAERDGTVFTVVGPASDDDMLALVESMPT